MTACRNSPICFAAATLSVIGISKFLEQLFSYRKQTAPKGAVFEDQIGIAEAIP
jgi:hypothetical protein